MVMQPKPSRALPGFEHVNRYWDKINETYAAKILPGEYYVTVTEELITTVLGSCVSACVWDAQAGVGGMNHFMLPHDTGGDGKWGAVDTVKASTRYGTYAMEQLVNDLLKYGARRQNLRVKAFGGGKIIRQMTDIGLRNITFIRGFLRTEGFPLVAEDLGDVYPRKVVFFPKTGRVLVKKLRSLHNNTIIEREERYMHDIESQPVQGQVELF